MITLLDIFQKMNKQKVKNKVIKFNLFQEEANKTKKFQRIIKKFVKDFTASGFGILTK